MRPHHRALKRAVKTNEELNHQDSQGNQHDDVTEEIKRLLELMRNNEEKKPSTK
jgi:hypothetical protein